MTAFRTPAEVDAFFYAVYVEGCKATPVDQTEHSGRLVTVADWRRCPVLPGEVADHLRGRIMANNKGVLRAAALAAPDSPSASMQFLRIVREAQLETRRIFFDPRELIRWLGEVLTGPEAARLEQFLNEPS